MKVIFLLAILTVLTNTNAYRSSAPLIKNIFRGDGHLEGPHWSIEENALYFVDITGQKVHRLDGQTGNITTKYIGYGPVSLVVTVKNNPKLILVSSRSELYFLPWDSESGDQSLRLLSVVDLGLPNNRINDGKVDAKGRLWFGTIGNEVAGVVDRDKATLYMLDEHNYANPENKVRPVSVSNGIAWTSDNKYMFYIDSPTRNVDVFDFNLNTGNLRNRRTLFSFNANNVTGVPDGMTIDTDGNLWVACYKGGKVIKIDSRAGKLLEQHKIEASQVSSVMWGGPELSTLFVTTSRRDLTPAQLAQEPEAGSLFAIQGTGSRGFPENQYLFADADKY
ncbi:regucalcin-like isoform X1 [Achroia grisella]|uniref:regucalcin-like isoform X1 n=1 Tax=Achroia grisella TaxID=688607 RepID=UPI0027D22A93|nr:regucalcin-like isoform X1 [Achroia grisella]